VKDLVGVAGFLALFSYVVFFWPNVGGFFLESANFQPANPLQTPLHIAPVWYFTPFYAILRAVPPLFDSQFPGVIAMFASILIFFFVPWLDRSPVKSIRYKGIISKVALGAFAVTFLVLGWIGTQPPEPILTNLARVLTVVYFAFFLLMPFYSKLDKTKPVPERVTP
jgi:ubiquinol-cytochrome c reductase cytochrome b subunit